MNCEGCEGKRQEFCDAVFSNSARRSSIAADATEKMVRDGDVERGLGMNAGIQKNIIMGLVEKLLVVKCELTYEEIQARILEERSKS